jgi:hypothetical protein
MSLSSSGNQGYLDVTNAILRVGTLDVYGITGVDMVTNVVKQNAVLVWDDQGADMSTPPFQLGAGVTRTTSPPEIDLRNASGDNFMYHGLKLPNQWMAQFDLYLDTGTTGNVHLQMYTSSTTTYDDDGYQFIFDAANSTLTLEYDGTQVQQSAVTYTTGWQTFVVTFNRGAWGVARESDVVFSLDDDERSAVYDNTSGQYLRFETDATTSRKVRYLKFTNSGPWLQSKTGDISFLTGNVSVGHNTTTHKLSVAGSANVGALTATSVNVAGGVDATSTSTGDLTLTGLGVESNIHTSNLYASEYVGVGTASAEAPLNVIGSSDLSGTPNNAIASFRATTAIPGTNDAGVVIGSVNGNLPYIADVSSASLGLSFYTQNNKRMIIKSDGNVAIGTHDPQYKLDVAGTANVGAVTLNSNVYAPNLPLAEIASNLVTWDSATGDLMDSGGLISNKLAIVSEQPPAALTGDSTVVDGHGRYKVTRSSVFNAYEGYNIFSKIETDNWLSATDTYNSDGTYAASDSLGGISGEWVKLEMPYKTTLRHFTLRQDIDNTNIGQRRQFPVDFKVIASNDDTNWTTINTTTGVSTPAANDPALTVVVNANTSYKYYAIVVEKISAEANSNRCQIGEWRLFTETFTVDAGVVSTTAASGLDVGYTEHPVVPIIFDEETYDSSNPVENVGRFWSQYAEGHGTYEITASTYYVNNGQQIRPPWRLFNHQPTDGSYWQQTFGIDGYGVLYNASSPYEYTGSTRDPIMTTTDVGGTRYLGHWVQIKVPNSVTLAHADVYRTPESQNSGSSNRAPGAGVFLGSNDGVAWYKLTEFSGASYASDDKERIAVNATTPYQYYRFVITNIVGGNSATVVSFNEWRLFAEKPVTRMENVHISGDLSSETLQTGYIKWPKVPLKAAESEGYVASASSTNSYFPPWKAFDGTYTDSGSWISAYPAYTAGGYTERSEKITDVNGVDYDGEWIKIKLPQKIALHSYKLWKRNGGANREPSSGTILASNDDLNWYKLKTFTGLTYSQQDEIVDIQQSVRYNHYALVIHTLNGGTLSTQISEIELFEAATGVGAAPTSAKLQVAGSLGMAKGAEFFAGDDVVMELPKHDRPLTKYPEVAMTAATTAGYTASASGNYNVTSYPPYEAFNGVYGTEFDIWISRLYVYKTSDGTADTSNCATFNGVYGEYLSLSMPKKIKLEKMRVHSRNNDIVPNAPHKGRVYGSNDNSNWTQIGTYDGLNMIHNDYRTIIVNATEYYKHYTFQVEQINPSFTEYGSVQIAELEYWGYEEGDTSVDVVHRSIPNKPGQQHLAVYWDANDSNSYSFADSSNVYDLSGSGVTGTITGTNGFDAEYNAWVFDGSGDYVSGTQGIGTGQVIHTWSLWVKNLTPTSTQYAYICGFGTAGSATMSGFMLRNGDRLEFNMYGTYVYVEEDFPNREGTWIHVVGVYRGNAWNATNCDVYIDGRKATTVGTATTTLNISGTAINIGSRPGGGQPFVGSIANARLYSKALNAEQVRELYEYDAPRFGHRQNLVALHKGNLGVGVAHPTSRFEVAGADGVQEFPPKAMTGHETYIDGHGVFRASASSENVGAERYSYTIFGKQGYWQLSDVNSTVTNGYALTSPYDANSYSPTTVDDSGTEHLGAWLKFECPYYVNMKHVYIMFNPNDARRADSITFLGSRNNATWHLIKNVNIPNQQTHDISLDTTSYYKSFILIVKSLTGAEQLDVLRVRYFGTPAPSAIEDGHLTLGKALTLPRVSGHAAGAETPRAESLVVHYDTTVDSVVSGSTVVDISGNGLNGTLTNGAAYSSTDRALTFDGVNDRITGTLNNPSGAWVNSVAFWFKRNVASGVSGYDYIYKSGISGGNGTSAMNIIITPTHELVWTIYNHTVFTPANTVVNDAWYHVVTVYRGGVVNLSNADIYVNGVKASNSTNGTAAATYPANATFVIGNNTTDNYNFNGSISNFKIWGGVALTAEEVAAEYALGRTGKSINLTDTSLCLGGTVPRAQLDVRGSARFDGRMIIGNSDQVADDLDDITPTLDVRGLDDSYIRAHCVAGRSAGLILSEGTNNQFIMEYEGAGAGAGNYVTFYSGETGWPDGAKGLGLNYVPQSGFVGIGRTNPVTPLHIKQNGTDGGGTADLDGQSNGGITVERSDTLNRWLQGINGNNNYHFWYDADGAGAATSKAFFDQDGSNNIDQNFTGQHRTFIKDIPFTQVGELEGLIVSADNNKYIKMSGGIEAGSNAITTNESLPVVSLSTKVNDKKCFGVISASEDPETRENRLGVLFPCLKKNSATPVSTSTPSVKVRCGW